MLHRVREEDSNGPPIVSGVTKDIRHILTQPNCSPLTKVPKSSSKGHLYKITAI